MAKKGVPAPPRLAVFRGGKGGKGKTSGADGVDPGECLLTSMPKAPADTDEVFRKWWKHYCSALLDAALLYPRDLATIEQVCAAHSDQEEAREELKFSPKYVMNQNGSISRHPAFVTIENARAFILKSHLLLGFSPRGRLQLPSDKAKRRPRVQGMARHG